MEWLTAVRNPVKSLQQTRPLAVDPCLPLTKSGYEDEEDNEKRLANSSLAMPDAPRHASILSLPTTPLMLILNPSGVVGVDKLRHRGRSSQLASTVSHIVGRTGMTGTHVLLGFAATRPLPTSHAEPLLNAQHVLIDPVACMRSNGVADSCKYALPLPH
ncbi:hypothetical protein B0H34DRAFT_284319 [Crassisporium funariophilum]|nr:hypothetical protein B0H34DRAFT_284319 [Crassisporium funariophilum]